MSNVTLFLGIWCICFLWETYYSELRNNLLGKIPETWDDTKSALYQILLSYQEFPDVEYVLECLRNLIPLQITQGGKFILNTNNDVRFIA